MLTKKQLGSLEWTNPDDAPKLTAGMLGDGEVFNGDQFVRRGRGRPPSNAPKEKVNFRLDPEVLERLRNEGPGWQTRINNRLVVATRVDSTLWDWIKGHIVHYQDQIINLEYSIELLKNGTMRSFTNDRDTTQEVIVQNEASLRCLKEGIDIMRATQRDLFQDAAS